MRDYGKYGLWRFAACRYAVIVLVPGVWSTTKELSKKYGVKLGKPTYPLKSDEVVGATFLYDCDGRGIPMDGSYKLTRTTRKWARPGLFDLRSLEDVQSGCCPPQLETEMLETAGMYRGRGDAVEEATRLHKTGYGIFRR